MKFVVLFVLACLAPALAWDWNDTSPLDEYLDIVDKVYLVGNLKMNISLMNATLQSTMSAA
jgi:hypothetical protein